MIAARLITRQRQAAAIRLLTSRSFPATAEAARKSVDQVIAVESSALPTHNLVKDAILKMMEVRNDEDLKPILDDELESKFRQLQNLHQEAESCIADLREAGENVEEEVECANSAVENCFNAFVELLEDLRRANEQQLEACSDMRLANVRKLKELRKGLSEMTPNVDPTP